MNQDPYFLCVATRHLLDMFNGYWHESEFRKETASLHAHSTDIFTAAVTFGADITGYASRVFGAGPRKEYGRIAGELKDYPLVKDEAFVLWLRNEGENFPCLVRYFSLVEAARHLTIQYIEEYLLTQKGMA
ncbi:MAG: hypothetical protein IH624_17310 [Phycisphaerae bacterium]|nr:hypothetical protein [Phycisphaerae bacterium]